MKKPVLWITAAMFLIMSVEPVLAVYTVKRLSQIKDPKEAKAYTARMKRFDRKITALLKNVSQLADKIAAYNQPVFEARLTKKEREFYEMGDETPSTSPIMWNRVWAKDKTITLGAALKDKKFWAEFFKTSDPELVFVGDIRVGASAKIVESYFGESLANIGTAKGNTITITGPLSEETDFFEPTVSITCVNGVVTEIFYDITAGGLEQACLSESAVKFANTRAKEMGFSGIR